MKILEVKTYTAIKLSGPKGSMDFFSKNLPSTKDIELERHEMGILLRHSFKTSEGKVTTHETIVPTANIAYITTIPEAKIAAKVKLEK